MIILDVLVIPVISAEIVSIEAESRTIGMCPTEDVKTFWQIRYSMAKIPMMKLLVHQYWSSEYWNNLHSNSLELKIAKQFVCFFLSDSRKFKIPPILCSMGQHYSHCDFFFFTLAISFFMRIKHLIN